MNLSKPMVFGDRILPLLVEVIKEMAKQDTAFVMDEQLSLYEDDAKNYARIRIAVVEVYQNLKRDNMRGDTALWKLDEGIFFPHKDLAFRLIESNKFPAFARLYDLLQKHYY